MSKYFTAMLDYYMFVTVLVEFYSTITTIINLLIMAASVEPLRCILQVEDVFMSL